MNEYPKCPKCGEELEPWRWDDFWAEDNNCVSAYVRGFCPKCHGLMPETPQMQHHLK